MPENQQGDEKKSSGTFIKIVVIAVIVYIAYSIIASFNFNKIPGLKNLGDAFNNLTGAFAYATSKWYLLGALLIIGAMLPAAYKWAGAKAGAGLKSNMSEDAFTAYSDAVIVQRSNEILTDESLTPDERTRWEENAADAQARWESASDDAKSEAKEAMEANGVEEPAK